MYWWIAFFLLGISGPGVGQGRWCEALRKLAGHEELKESLDFSEFDRSTPASLTAAENGLRAGDPMSVFRLGLSWRVQLQLKNPVDGQSVVTGFPFRIQA